MMQRCTHFEGAAILEPATNVCQECVAVGSGWVHLRLCLACGHVGCCDSSPLKHASAHYRESGDPVIRSIEPGETWAYCFPDDLFVEDLSDTTG
ncbi:MAG TPA: UBP-type zinc finger domain-containing protein [Actinomycetota bacterium]|nr:UBP-type zinc finger domain-containing protein [Actinomycetota bacterium]